VVRRLAQGRREGKTLLAALALLLFAACASADPMADPRLIHDPDPRRFSFCHGGSCDRVQEVGLDAGQWRRITETFGSAAPDAHAERAAIARTIARFEQIVGELTDTTDDRAENGLGNAWWTQLDCIDESVNTTTYLRLLAGAGLLRWHAVDAPQSRGWFLFGWPHSTAVIRERAGGALWAVDSWFFDNGEPPVIVPITVWKQTRWRPAAAGYGYSLDTKSR